MKITTEQILQYIQNSLAEEDKEAVEKEMAASPSLREEANDMRRILNATEQFEKQKRIDTKDSWKKLARRISLLKLRENLWNATRTAAAIILPVIIALQIYIYSNGTAEKDEEEIEVSSAYGLVSQISLPDGTKVWLNSGSKLKYPKTFDKKIRHVTLSGEAYFEVEADPKHRFEVKTHNGITVSAYGTDFNVNAYDDDERSEIALSKGHVTVSTDLQVIPSELSPGLQAIIHRNDKKIAIADANIYAQTAWIDGKMVFRRAKMDEVAKKLSRHFNIDIFLKDDILHTYEYSATFTTESINEILNLLKKSAPIEWDVTEPKKQDDFTYQKRKITIRAIK